MSAPLLLAELKRAREQAEKLAKALEGVLDWNPQSPFQNDRDNERFRQDMELARAVLERYREESNA